jgi:hypothetical protein
MNQQERENLIALVYDAENIEIAREIMKGFEWLTLEDRREVICVGRLKYSIESNPTLFTWLLNPSAYSEYVASRFDKFGRLRPIGLQGETSRAIIDRHVLKLLGYNGRRLLTRNKKQYAQFFCGKSKPSFEIEITPNK